MPDLYFQKKSFPDSYFIRRKKGGARLLYWARRVHHGRERRGETRRAALKEQRSAHRRRARGCGGLAAHARLRWRLDVTRAAAAAGAHIVGTPLTRRPRSSSRSRTSPSSTRHTRAALSTTRLTASSTLMTPETPAPAAREKGALSKFAPKKGVPLFYQPKETKKKEGGCLTSVLHGISFSYLYL